MRRVAGVIVVLLVAAACGPSVVPLRVSIADHNGTLGTVFALRKVIVLETKPESKLGGIDVIRTPGPDSDIWIGDFKSQATIFRFSSEGRFISRIVVSTNTPEGDNPLVDFIVGHDNAITIAQAHTLTARGTSHRR